MGGCRAMKYSGWRCQGLRMGRPVTDLELLNFVLTEKAEKKHKKIVAKRRMLCYNSYNDI